MMRLRAKGFTLVEILVAVTLLGIGVTAWLGTSAAALRLSGEARRAVAAARRAHDRATRIASGGCAGLAPGSAPGERWSVTLTGNGVWLIQAEVTFATRRGERVAVYELMVSC